MHVGCLSLVLVAVGTMECTERESLIRQISIVDTTQCLMDCTVLTFAKIMELGDNRSIRMKDSSKEEQRSKNGIFNNRDSDWPGAEAKRSSCYYIPIIQPCFIHSWAVAGYRLCKQQLIGPSATWGHTLLRF